MLLRPLIFLNIAICFIHGLSVDKVTVMKLGLQDSKLSVPSTAIEPAKIDALSQVATWMAREKLFIPVSRTDISCMTCPAFSMVYIEELERLENNFHTSNNASEHLMFTVTRPLGSCRLVLAYADLDRRADYLGSAFPKPYISDVIVSPSHRRQVRSAAAPLQSCFSFITTGPRDVAVRALPRCSRERMGRRPHLPIRRADQ
jgi:hypothetical protein